VPHPGMRVSSDTLAAILRGCPQLTSLQTVDYESGMLGVLAAIPTLGSLEIHLEPDIHGSRVLSDLATFVSAPGCFSGKFDTSMTARALKSHEQCEAWNQEIARLADRASFHLDAKVTQLQISFSSSEEEEMYYGTSLFGATPWPPRHQAHWPSS
jgi:hypothetical protein